MGGWGFLRGWAHGTLTQETGPTKKSILTECLLGLWFFLTQTTTSCSIYTVSTSLNGG